MVWIPSWLRPRAKSFPKPAQHGGAIIRSMDEYDALQPHLYPPQDEEFQAIEPWAAR